MNRFVIMGPQGAGKGTQAAQLTTGLGIPHISTGDLFRVNTAAGTELGIRARAYIDNGKLVPDEVTQGMVVQRLGEPDAAKGFLFDGFPRNTAQAIWLAATLDKLQAPIDAVVLLVAPEPVLLQRMLVRGRGDDTVEAIATRLEIYRRETTPLVDYYGDRVVQVDGLGQVDEVAIRIRAALVSSGVVQGG